MENKTNLTLVGTVEEILETFYSANSSFRSKEFICTVKSFYNGALKKDWFKFKLVGDNIELLNLITIGNMVEIQFNITGTQWKKKGSSQAMYFTNLEVHELKRIDVETEETNEPEATNYPDIPQVPLSEKPKEFNYENDQLPF